jgi:hypothetical protein
MKLSEAILKGYERVGGRQCKHAYYENGTPSRPEAVCVMGAVSLALSGNAAGDVVNPFAHKGVQAFVVAWDMAPSALNDEGMPWEHIYGMAVAAGL